MLKPRMPSAIEPRGAPCSASTRDPRSRGRARAQIRTRPPGVLCSRCARGARDFPMKRPRCSARSVVRLDQRVCGLFALPNSTSKPMSQRSVSGISAQNQPIGSVSSSWARALPVPGRRGSRDGTRGPRCPAWSPTGSAPVSRAAPNTRKRSASLRALATPSHQCRANDHERRADDLGARNGLLEKRIGEQNGRHRTDRAHYCGRSRTDQRDAACE